MILQALHGYYHRKMADPDPARRLPAAGLEDKEIPFVLELALDGRLVAITDTRTPVGKKKIAKRFLVPHSVKRAVNVAANLLWDTAEYVLGLNTRGNHERLAQQVAAFRQRVDELAARVPDDAGLLAVQLFLNHAPLRAAQQHAYWLEIEQSNPVLAFRLANDVDLVCQRSRVAAEIALISSAEPEDDDVIQTCLITGEAAVTERLHNAIKGVWGAQTSGANIVSINNKITGGTNGGKTPAFSSFGKQQGYNSPVSKNAAFAYTTALNHLLAKGSRQRIQVGDASTVFWAHEDKDTDMEDGFAALFGETDDPDHRTEKVRALFESIHAGRFDGNAGEREFYVLGLAPNAARIAVRFWHAAPLKLIAQRIQDWFIDIAVARGPKDPEYPSLFRLLTAVAVQGKADNVPPNLGGDIMRSILSGAPFPALWLNAAVQRCRAERDVNNLRAAAIKACLNRSTRHHALQLEEVYSPMLDKNNPNVAYRIGRLFATLEKIQEETSPSLNATIRDRYFGAASSTPAAVFPTLLRLKNHHIAKLARPNRAAYFEKLLGEILGGFHEFPGHMPLTDQGRFALGYYHQRQDFFTKHEKDSAAPAEIRTEKTTEEV